MILPDFFWLWLVLKMKVLSHPFNEAKGGAMELNYSPWEYKYAASKTGLGIFEPYTGPLDDLVRGKKIADLACGGGGKSVYLAGLGAREVKGCDMSKNFIEQAENFARGKGCSNCIFELGNAEKTNYQDGEFDIVLLASILEHVEHPENMMREAVRICKSGGLILINTEGYWHWLGHHMWDALPIPWLHVFTSEKQRIRLYKKAVAKYQDAQARIDFRITRDEMGRERVGYLNMITLKKMEKMVRKLRKEGLVEIKDWEVLRFRSPVFRMAGRMPLLREMFHERVVGVLRKN